MLGSAKISAITCLETTDEISSSICSSSFLGIFKKKRISLIIFLNLVVLCKFAETLIVISKEENTSHRSRCTRVQVNKSDGDEFKEEKFNLRKHKKAGGQVL